MRGEFLTARHSLINDHRSDESTDKNSRFVYGCLNIWNPLHFIHVHFEFRLNLTTYAIIRIINFLKNVLTFQEIYDEDISSLLETSRLCRLTISDRCWITPMINFHMTQFSWMLPETLFFIRFVLGFLSYRFILLVHNSASCREVSLAINEDRKIDSGWKTAAK